MTPTPAKFQGEKIAPRRRTSLRIEIPGADTTVSTALPEGTKWFFAMLENSATMLVAIGPTAPTLASEWTEVPPGATWESPSILTQRGDQIHIQSSTIGNIARVIVWR